jgi:hypothetical protein
VKEIGTKKALDYYFEKSKEVVMSFPVIWRNSNSGRQYCSCKSQFTWWYRFYSSQHAISSGPIQKHSDGAQWARSGICTYQEQSWDRSSTTCDRFATDEPPQTRPRSWRNKVPQREYCHTHFFGNCKVELKGGIVSSPLIW